MPERSAPVGNPSPSASGVRGPEGFPLACAVILAAAAAAAYAGTFAVPFLFDDATSVTGNPTLHRWATVLRAPAGTTVSGRPVLNLSLALNFALSGPSVWSYHALNLAIHVLAGLTLFGIVRRTLAPRVGPRATAMGFAVAVVWTLHPLLTESVTYVIQRAESLMGLFYLLTLYCLLRGAGTDGPGRHRWYALSIAACLLGMGTKEVMVSAPLLALLYDRTFLAGSFREAFRRRGWVYGGLASTWVLLFFLVLSAHGRSGTAGFGSGVPWGSYALAQLPAIAHYLRLAVWPHPLIFDYGTALTRDPAAVAAGALVVAALAAATLWALVRRPAAGFLGAAFFALIAPSSSVVPVATEAVAEHRMYLALIPVVVFAVAAAFRWLGRSALPVCLLAAAVLSCATWQRNRDYRSDEAIWRDTVEKRPGNERAQDNLGFALAAIPGRSDEAVEHYEEALRIKPDFFDAHSNLAYLLLGMPGRREEAIAHYAAALRLRPLTADVHFNLARALQDIPGRRDEAIAHYREALRLKPDYAEAHYNLGYLLQSMPGGNEAAAAQFREALRLKPDNPGAHFSLACLLQADPGGLGEAIAQYEEAVRLKPDYVEARCNLGNALNASGRTPEAIAQYEEAALLRPDDPTIHVNFAIILLGVPGRAAEAAAHLNKALRLEPGNERARSILARLNASMP
jgi:tetratricopeptide (TPR) repeat protein